MPGQVRVGDLCIAHALGTYMMGANTAVCEGQPQCRVGDMIMYVAPPIIGMALTGSSTVVIENTSAHRVGDAVLGGGIGVAISGSALKTTG